MPPTPQDWLRSTPRGAYTTLQVRGARQELVDWPTHLQRLVRSLKAMHETLDIYSRYYSWLAASGTPEQAALQQLLAPHIQAALQSAAQAGPAAQQWMLVIVLPPSPESPSGLDVRLHVQPMGGPPAASPGTAVALGGPRGVPVGKDSGWVAERQPLEALRPPGAAEVLLCAQDGRLLEGLVTNLFVVAAAGGGDGGCGESAGSQCSDGGGSNGRPVDSGSSPPAALAAAAGAAGTAAAPSGFDPASVVVYTAGMGDGVVWGTARARVLEACRQLGLAVREDAPHPADRATWREAFLTNSLRLVQPLTCIACGAANVWGLPPWELALPQAPGPVTSAVRGALLGLLPAVPAAELGPASPPKP